MVNQYNSTEMKSFSGCIKMIGEGTNYSYNTKENV
jgi:hypothetical protein